MNTTTTTSYQRAPAADGEPGSTAVGPWTWTDNHRRRITLTYRAEGWPLEPTDYRFPGLKLCMCGSSTFPRCQLPPVWRIVRRDQSGTLTGYHCDGHLSDDDRPPNMPLPPRAGEADPREPECESPVVGTRPRPGSSEQQSAAVERRSDS